MSQQDELIHALNAQLAAAVDGGAGGPVRLAAEGDAARELERRLNALIAGGRPRGGGAADAPRDKLGWFLDSIVENAPTMLFVKDARDLTVELWNKLAEEISGVKSEDIVGKTGFESFPAEEMEGFLRRDREVISGKKLVAVEESLTHAGRTRWLHTKKIPLLDERGEPRYLLGISEDITERKRADEEIRRAKEAAESASRAKTEFFANVSHELRTPLTLILGTLDAVLLGEAGELPEVARERLARMRRNAARLTSLVNDLLDFSRIEAGKMEVRWQPVPAVEIVSEIVEDARSTATARGLELTFEAGESPGHLPLDRRMFEKIVLNLIGNALKFTPAGGRIDVRAGMVDGELELLVRDTGVGIPAEKLPLLFERFQQVDSSISRKYEGTGIGLALVKEFAELMGGRAGVESELGRGARFFVRIPRREEHLAITMDAGVLLRSEDPFAHLVPAPRASDDLAWSGKPRIIVAEDNPDMRAYLRDLLAAEHDVVAVENGKQALAAARARLPDAIVSDVMMPEMNGFELVAALKGDPALKQVPVLLLTARAGSEAIASGLEGGADDYLSKPFSPAELRARIAAARRLHRAYQDLALHLDELVKTRDQLVEAEKLSLAGRLARGVARELSGPLTVLRTRLVISGASREAREGLARVEELVAGLGRLMEPPELTRPERVELAPFIEDVLGELPVGRTGRVTQIEQVGWTEISPGDLRVAVANVLSYLGRSDRVSVPAAPIGVRVHQERGQPCVTISDTALRLSPNECAQLLEPRLEVDGAAGGGLRLDVGLAIANQILRRNGAELRVRAMEPRGVMFQMSFEGVSRAAPGS
jgi:PAS domain S-box-containing protein